MIFDNANTKNDLIDSQQHHSLNDDDDGDSSVSSVLSDLQISHKKSKPNRSDKNSSYTGINDKTGRDDDGETLDTDDESDTDPKEHVYTRKSSTHRSIVSGGDSNDGYRARPRVNVSDFISVLVNTHVHMKMFHWQTSSYNKHKVIGKFIADLEQLTDKFVETYVGATGDKLGARDIVVKISKTNMASEKYTREVLKKLRTFLSMRFNNVVPKTIIGLENIRDDMLVAINHTLYLYNLE